MNNLFAKKVPIIFIVWVYVIFAYIHPYFLTVFSEFTAKVLSFFIVLLMPFIDGLVESTKTKKD